MRSVVSGEVVGSYFDLRVLDLQTFSGMLRASDEVGPYFCLAQTFCPSQKARFSRKARASVGIDVINYAIKYATKMNAKFCYWDEIKFTKTRNNKVAAYRSPLTGNGFQLKASCYLEKNYTEIQQ